MSNVTISWPTDFPSKGSDLHPLPLSGEICRITTSEASDRDAGGCPSPQIAALVLLRAEGGGFEVRQLSYRTSRNWDNRHSWRCESGVGISEPIHTSATMPAFIWRKCESAYHMDFDSAIAEVEVVVEPMAEWLVQEMAAIGEEISLEDAEFILAQRGLILGNALAEDEPILHTLEGVWLERSRIDIRSLALRWLAAAVRDDPFRLRHFADSRAPYWDLRSHIDFDYLMLQGERIARVPKAARKEWKKQGFSAPVGKRR